MKFVDLQIYHISMFEACFGTREWLESVRHVGEINSELIDAPNGLTATRFSKKR